VQVNEINGIINSDRFSRSYDDLYLGVTFFWGGALPQGVVVQCLAVNLCFCVLQIHDSVFA